MHANIFNWSTLLDVGICFEGMNQQSDSSTAVDNKRGMFRTISRFSQNLSPCANIERIIKFYLLMWKTQIEKFFFDKHKPCLKNLIMLAFEFGN